MIFCAFASGQEILDGRKKKRKGGERGEKAPMERLTAATQCSERLKIIKLPGLRKKRGRGGVARTLPKAFARPI